MIRSCPLTGKLSSVPAADSEPPARGCPAALYASDCLSTDTASGGARISNKIAKEKGIETVLKKSNDLAPVFLQRGRVKSVNGRKNYIEGVTTFRSCCHEQDLDLCPMRAFDKSLIGAIRRVPVLGAGVAVSPHGRPSTDVF